MSETLADQVINQLCHLGRGELVLPELTPLLEEVSDDWLDAPASSDEDLVLVVARFIRHFNLEIWAPELMALTKSGTRRSAEATALLPAWLLRHGAYQRPYAQLISRSLAPQSGTELPAGEPPPLTLGGAAQPVLLRANRPTTVRLRVPADLRFQQAALRLAGLPLLRDLAASMGGALRWGGEGLSASSGAKILTLRQPARIAAVVLTSGRLAAIIAELRRTKDPDALSKTLFAACVLNAYRNYAVSTLAVGHPGALTDCSGTKQLRRDEPVPVGRDATFLDLAAKPHGAGDALTWQVLSPSCARAVAVGVGDDTPQQVLGAEIAEGVSVTTRDLTGAFQAARARALPAADAPGFVDIPIPLLSVQDGLVTVAVVGAGERYAVVAPLTCELVPLQPCAVPLPALASAPGAQVQVRSQGQATGGVVLDLGIMATPARFAVLVDEHLHVAQALRLRAFDAAPGVAATLVAVWLCLEDLPSAAVQVRLAVAVLAGEGFAPGNELGVCTATLPVDRAAYEQRSVGSGWWYRVPWTPGLELDGVQAGQALALMASGEAAGLRLLHTRLETGDPLPASNAAGAGSAHYRHLDRDRSWRQRLLLLQPTRWLMAIELAPQDDEPVVTLVADGAVQPLHVGGGRLRGAWSGAAASVQLVARVAAHLELTGEVTAPP